MATRKLVQQEDIIKMNDLYLELKTYAAVARVVGFSASTVKKYILTDYIPIDKIKTIIFNSDILAIEDIVLPISNEGWIKLLKLTEEEKLENEELRKEIQL